MQIRGQRPERTEVDRSLVTIPSREAILEALARDSIPLAELELAKRMGVPEEAQEVLHRRVNAMARDGQILRNRKGALLIAEKLDLISGRVNGHPDGHGYLHGDDGNEYVLAPREMHQVLHGDRVLLRPTGIDRRGRREGAIVEVLERAQKRVVGRFHREHGVFFVVASDRRISQDILIQPDSIGNARTNQIVTVELVEQPSRHVQPIGRVIEVLGHATDPGMEIEIALRKHQLPFEFSAAAIKRAERYTEAIRPAQRAGRTDLTTTPLVTIDGETARDFDDAVFAERDGRGYRLLVAIADVSHYVRPGDAFDREARERGTSVYFPRRVIPMLPEHLSNGLCSLNPNVERLAMVCEMSITKAGRVAAHKFYPAVIRSAARLTYTQVAAVLYQSAGADAGIDAALIPHLRCLDEVFQSLLNARKQRGAIEFESSETELVFNDEGKIEGIRAIVRNDAHRLIEECMLAANVCAAIFLEEHDHKLLYRVHAGPTPEKLDNLREFLREFGLGLGGGSKPTTKDYARLMESIKDRPDRALMQTVLLRSMQQAMYSPDNEGHFGLAFPAYAHFTSPIRRYPDLVVHRAIKAVLAKEHYEPGDWRALGENASMTERRADDASRDAVQWLKCFFMKDKVNEEFDGTISAVTSFGIFVQLEALFVEGLVHISELGSDYFKFDAARHELRGERGLHTYRLSGKVRVRVAHVDMDLARIDFRLAD
ncbi:MAG: ribonuclease R [Betaproteobacteria bacterium]|nr:ribonuclease R [Betaproteobacteria bacterium]